VTGEAAEVVEYPVAAEMQVATVATDDLEADAAVV